MALPDVCVMEAISAFDWKRIERNRLKDELDRQLNQLQRSIKVQAAQQLATELAQADLTNAKLLAQLFVTFRQAIDSGLHGIKQTRQALANSIELIYLHSPVHQAALNLYRLSVEGQLKVEDEPLEVINAAIQRTTSRIRGRKSSTRASKGR